MSAQTRLIQTTMAVAIGAIAESAQSAAQPAAAQARRREPPPTAQPYVVVTDK